MERDAPVAPGDVAVATARADRVARARSLVPVRRRARGRRSSSGCPVAALVPGPARPVRRLPRQQLWSLAPARRRWSSSARPVRSSPRRPTATAASRRRPPSPSRSSSPGDRARGRLPLRGLAAGRPDRTQDLVEDGLQRRPVRRLARARPGSCCSPSAGRPRWPTCTRRPAADLVADGRRPGSSTSSSTTAWCPSSSRCYNDESFWGVFYEDFGYQVFTNVAVLAFSGARHPGHRCQARCGCRSSCRR